jgi:NADPH:quinone reductase
MSDPKTMRAVLLNETGPSSNLTPSTSHPLPTIKPGHILIRNAYAGINYIDTYFRSGLYPSATGYPLILGQEAAGTVADANSDDPTIASLGFRNGDRVVWIKQGGYAEYTLVPADRVVKIPEGLGEDLAVGGFLMGMTALSLIKEAYAVKKGERVLVHAAAGGVGLLLCQLLKEVGAFVIGTAGGEVKGKLAKEHGADVVVDYSKEKWVERVMEITEGKGVDVVYDGVGETTWEGSLKVTRRKGKGMLFCWFRWTLRFRAC